MKELDNLIDELQAMYKQRLCSVLIFGSKANCEPSIVKSNIDLMIVIQKFSSHDLKDIQPLISKWIKAKNPHPIIVSKDEFFSMKSVYIAEYADIKWNYQTIFGEDLFKDIEIPYHELKNHCIQELTNLIMKFRGYYLQYGQDRKSMKKAFLSLTESSLVIFRNVLRLQNTTPSVYKNDLIDQISEITRIDKVSFKRLVAFKERVSDLPDYILDDGVMLTLNQLGLLLQQLQAM